jgi:hypothetical protein
MPQTIRQAYQIVQQWVELEDWIEADEFLGWYQDADTARRMRPLFAWLFDQRPQGRQSTQLVLPLDREEPPDA